jgi:PhoH-like ATPase
VADWYPGECLFGEGDDAFEAIVRERRSETEAVIELVEDYRSQRHNVWGITARNREQNFALNMLMDPELDFVTLLGTAGTGKTLLALAAGLAQVLDRSIYREIIMTRVTVPVGEDIGFLPGTEEEKMTPWMGALMDNMEVLTQTEGGDWGRAATNDLLRSRVRVAIVAQLHARAHLPAQVHHPGRGAEPDRQADEDADHPRRARHQDRLPRQYRADRHALPDRDHLRPDLRRRPLQGLAHSGHITLIRGERSRLADFASDRAGGEAFRGHRRRRYRA